MEGCSLYCIICGWMFWAVVVEYLHKRNMWENRLGIQCRRGESREIREGRRRCHVTCLNKQSQSKTDKRLPVLHSKGKNTENNYHPTVTHIE